MLILQFLMKTTVQNIVTLWFSTFS